MQGNERQWTFRHSLFSRAGRRFLRKPFRGAAGNPREMESAASACQLKAGLGGAVTKKRKAPDF